MIETQNSKFQYITPRIIEFVFNAYPECEEKRWTININHDKEIIRYSYNEAKVTLKMVIRSTEDQTPFDFKFSVYSNFKWDNIDESRLADLLNRTAPSLLLGYARPIISMFTNSSGMPPYNLPMIDFSEDPLLDIAYHD